VIQPEAVGEIHEMTSSSLLREAGRVAWPFTGYWLFGALMYLWLYPSPSLGYESGLAALFFLLSLFFGLIFIIPSAILERLDPSTTRDQQQLIVFVATLGLALLLDLLLRWFVRRACVPRTSGSSEDWIA